MNLILPLKFLKAAIICMPTKDIRFYLNAVRFECVNQQIRLVVTDGHRILCQDTNIACGEFEPFLLPATAAIAICKQKAENFSLTVNPDQLNQWLCDGVSSAWTPTEGRFPDYTRHFPAEPAAGHDDACGFNASYIADGLKIHKARAESSYPAIRIKSNGSSAAEVELFLAGTRYIVMPMRV